MNKEEKIKFIKDALERLGEKMLSNVDKMPENWDGWELRWYLVDNANEFVWSDMKNERKRRRDYENDVATYNL